MIATVLSLIAQSVLEAGINESNVDEQCRHLLPTILTVLTRKRSRGGYFYRFDKKEELPGKLLLQFFGKIGAESCLGQFFGKDEGPPGYY